MPKENRRVGRGRVRPAKRDGVRSEGPRDVQSGENEIINRPGYRLEFREGGRAEEVEGRLRAGELRDRDVGAGYGGGRRHHGCTFGGREDYLDIRQPED